ncbi:hypothetical protein ACI2LF_43070 [Kribbella sp. NPDC020789]|uniref:Uncharacterized protein n=1 Tax=Streptomyces pseudogriseolus TaxID=36817 RepID=A0ABQ2TAQ7_STREZ|nr:MULTISPECIES: hypothetical protein [Streptomyces]GGS60682.1 hypothetical protein GCM10010285_44970 [Streptomyces rubiginosus]
MSNDSAPPPDLAAATVLLAAEAAVLTERVRLLRGQLAEVSARIQETARRLNELPASPVMADDEDR